MNELTKLRRLIDSPLNTDGAEVVRDTQRVELLTHLFSNCVLGNPATELLLYLVCPGEVGEKHVSRCEDK
ncbi:hypothetical protein D3C85_1814860 [compost metagenome]